MTPAAVFSSPCKILFVIINFNGAGLTCGLIQSLRQLRGYDSVSVVVVDNASTDDSLEALRTALDGTSDVSILASTHWRGYLGAAQWGVTSGLGDATSKPDWIIVANNDILIDDRGFFEALLAMDPDSVGVVAPATMSMRTGLNQNPFMETRPSRFRLWRLRFWVSSYAASVIRAFLSEWLVTPMRRRYRQIVSLSGRSRAASGPRRIYAPHGSFLIFSRRFFDLGAVLENACGISGEELIVAQTCRRLGLAVSYEPALEVQHHEHATHGSAITRTMYEHQRCALELVAPKILSDT